MRTHRNICLVLGVVTVLWMTAIFGTTSHAAGDTVLTGKITGPSGVPMEGVIVSARQFGKTFTTSVFTDAAGEYYFPRMEEGKYNIWAQGVGYDAGIVEGVTVGPSVHRQHFSLKTLENFEMQLRGDEWTASLPEDTPHDRKMKEVFRLNCFGGCHSPSHALKDRYDEQGWKILIDKMSRIATPGTYTLAEDRNVAPLMHYYKDELAAWLARVRGPAPNKLTLKPRPRAKGDATLAVYREYDSSPPGFGVPLYNDGSLWQLGPANKTDLKNMGPLRATVDLDGNPWFTGRGRGYWTIAKIDWMTGRITGYKVTNDAGAVVDGGEMITDRQGIVWTMAAGKLVKIDRAGRMQLIDVPEPETVRRAQGATIPPESKGKERIWWEDGPRPAVCSGGICENPPTVFYAFEPSTGRWAVYDNPPAPRGMKAFSDVYNVTSMGDADGNGWWAQFATDVIVKADGSAPGKVVTIKIPERKNPAWDLFTGDDRRIFEMMGGSEPHTRGMPNQHSMRMVGAGPGPTDSMWGVGWFSSDLIRVNIRTNRLTVYNAPAPDCGSYQTWTDPHGEVWTVCQSSAHIRRFNPATERWTIYDMPTMNIEAHALGMAPGLVNGRIRMVVPSWTNSKTILMEVRTPEDVAALKAEVGKTTAQSPQPAASVDAQAVQYQSGSTPIDAYLARPRGATRRPGVIVLHDDLGMNNRFRELAHQFAEAGFVALAPHLPSRAKAAAAEPGEGRPQRTAVVDLSSPQTVADLRAAFAFLQQDTGVIAERISAVGVGWGEYRVWTLAETTPALYRAVVFYGVIPTDDDRLRTIQTPVLGHYAELDYLITARVLKTKQLLGSKFTYYIYPTVPGFFGGGTGQIQPATGGSVISLPSGPQRTSASAAAKLAWTRTLEFLK